MKRTLKTEKGFPVEVNETIAGHLLWEAMADFRREYEALTAVCHRLSRDGGGPDTREEFGGSASYDIPEDRSVGMHGFTQRAKSITERMLAALRRADEFAYGEVYDDLIDPALLGPQVSEDGRRRTYHVDDKSLAPSVFVKAEESGLRLHLGINPETPKPQPYVVVSTEEMGDHWTLDNGEPVLAVSLNDADLYDKERE
jgi:hypothetical protein